MTKDEQIRRIWEESMVQSGCLRPLACVLLVITFAAIMLSSCSTKERIVYRDNDIHHYITNTVHDTLRENTHDSVYVEVKTVGDTVYNTKYVERTRWRDRIVQTHDTCWRDSVHTEYVETTKEVVKIPKLYQGTLAFSILMLIFALVKFIRWLR